MYSTNLIEKELEEVGIKDYFIQIVYIAEIIPLPSKGPSLHNRTCSSQVMICTMLDFTIRQSANSINRVHFKCTVVDCFSRTIHAYNPYRPSSNTIGGAPRVI